ncbi:conjugative relaxase-like TrwC/TraI family protein [Kribbella sp. VKM Ac-2527]|uniref:Conjugative relaxase-like TrwC/TraI family protein n=1 Tax=Kribbella caucasensis TaxID=2512215 RepID=A0A4R6IYQ4_9ACTN|nr:MobF family relaxase [Kribbella sp. VKM Ac-2527]TDO27943.1 conjugative relaxase-like TrwC/TraI family protein [Kribbella sp. VKM Ac-2527]
MLSIHRLTAGDGYTYLLKHVATADVDRRMATPLTSYYAASGYPAGRWMGTGLAGLGDGQLSPGDEVTEEQMAALFGRAEDPLTGRALGRPYPVSKSPAERVAEQIRALDPTLDQADKEREIDAIRSAESRRKSKQAVAGFDLTFSPVKSVSALWATSDVGVQEQIVAAHHEAIDDVIGLIERQAAFTRTGDGGIAQITTKGLIATAFDHWDTRSGDPQLHTHVVIANRVQGPDGKWRTLDGRVLYAAIVAMSEVHNVLLADNLSRRLGVVWDLRDRGERRNPAYEIDGIPDELIREFSSRTEQIEENLNALLQDRDGIHPPGRRETYVLRQQATLMNRPAKHVAQPLADMMRRWRERADQVTQYEATAIVEKALDKLRDRPLSAADLSPETIHAYGATTVLALQTKRSTWNRWNLLAEAARQTRLLRISSSADRLQVLQSIVQSAEQQSISITPPAIFETPAKRPDGQSVFTIHNGEVFTSPVILGAESLLLDLATKTDGPTLQQRLPTTNLSEDKIQALHRITTSGQKVEALVGPAGTGKTSLLAALKTSWESAHGEGSVIALAPSSAAATVLSDTLGLPADNVAKWIHEAVGVAADQRNRWISDLEQAANVAQHTRRKRRHQRITTELARTHTERDRWRFRQDQLVIVDEASMASTMELATLAREADKAGAKLLLVGDDAQLGAADTGGAFRLIAHDTKAAELSDVWRFTHHWERDASLALRQGQPDVIDMYDEHQRLAHGSTEDMENAAYLAWRADTFRGRTSLLIAADNTTVSRLNARARLDRITTGEVEPDGIPLHDGNHVSIGDRIVTRLNNRRLRIGKLGFVQNGNIWTVIRRWDDGSLTVQNDDLETVTLPSTYVRESVELAYATTAHRAQGATVDTAHLLVTDQLTRALMYVGMTRGRDTNHAYVVTHNSPTEMHEPPFPQTMQDVLEAVLENDGIERSAHEVMRDQLDAATRLDRLVPIHEHLCQLDACERYRDAITNSGLDTVEQIALQASPAFGPLIAELRRAEHAGLDVAAALHRAVSQSSLANANDLAAVLHARVGRLVSRAERRLPRPPHLIAGLVTPADHATNPSYAAALREIEAQIIQRADWLAEKAVAENQIWFRSLKRAFSDRPDRRWHTHLREVAAYRERYGIRSNDTLGAAPDAAFGQHHYQRSRFARAIGEAQQANNPLRASDKAGVDTTTRISGQGDAPHRNPMP